MFDLREHKDLIHSLVAEADKNDTNWEWSVESIDQMNARIRWGYLEYCEQVHTVAKTRVGDYIDKLSKYEVEDVDAAIVISLGLENALAAARK